MRKEIEKHLFQPLVLMLVCGTVALLTAVAQTPKDLGTLSDGEHDLKGGETHSFRVSLTSGQFLHALVEQINIDVTTAVFAPDGKQITESNSPNDRWGTEPILFVAPAPGVRGSPGCTGMSMTEPRCAPVSLRYAPFG